MFVIVTSYNLWVQCLMNNDRYIPTHCNMYYIIKYILRIIYIKKKKNNKNNENCFLSIHYIKK